MITGTEQNYSYTQFNDETFGDLSLCNFDMTQLNNCVFTGAIYGCNFEKAVFSGCSFAAAVFTACNFADAAGINSSEIAGDANNFEGVV